MKLPLVVPAAPRDDLPPARGLDCVVVGPHELDFHDIVFEAPTKSSQAWFIQHFGPDVNLGNIPPEEVIPLETLRLGLRGDTLKEVLLGDAEPAAS